MQIVNASRGGSVQTVPPFDFQMPNNSPQTWANPAQTVKLPFLLSANTELHAKTIRRKTPFFHAR